jgi:hypothetical protein
VGEGVRVTVGDASLGVGVTTGLGISVRKIGGLVITSTTIDRLRANKNSLGGIVRNTISIKTRKIKNALPDTP